MPKIDSGDNAFVLASAALVMLMTPGLALFYGGMVRRKNVLSILMQCFFILALVSVQWVLFGYSLAFGPDRGGLIGGLEWLGLRGVGADPNPDYAASIPHLTFMVFQLMFAIITPALIAGAFAERMRFAAFAVFTVLWASLVYDPLAHWVWGAGGWLRERGALDFAGGTVVHISSGVSALVAALVTGRRRDYGSHSLRPHNLALTVVGAGLLWFGWFGFNAGSALAANGLATNALVVTHVSAAAATFGWVLAEWLASGKPTVFGAASGAVAGLVAITPAAGFVAPMPAIVIGAVAGVLCYLAVTALKPRLGYDDSLDVFGVHGVGGTWGAIATSLFASRAVNPAGADGLLYGNPALLGTHLLAVLATWLFAGGMTFVLLKAIAAVMPLRVSPAEEEIGLDISQHGEEAYGDLAPGPAAAMAAAAPVVALGHLGASPARDA